MFGWEREALGIDTLGEIRGAIRTRMRIDLTDRSPHAWWIATLYGPDIWETWRVGVLRGSFAAHADEPVALPDPLVFRLPGQMAAGMLTVRELWDRIAVVPAVVEDRALAFVASGVADGEEVEELTGPRERWELIAPTRLVSRLGLADGQQVAVRLLPSSLHRPEPSRHR